MPEENTSKPKVDDVRVTVTRERYERRECEVCEEVDADYVVSFLLLNARTNPASKGYGRDDLSWCADAKTYACAKCKDKARDDPPEGMSWCATFTGERFPHMIHHWREISKEVKIERAVVEGDKDA